MTRVKNLLFIGPTVKVQCAINSPFKKIATCPIELAWLGPFSSRSNAMLPFSPPFSTFATYATGSHFELGMWCVVVGDECRLQRQFQILVKEYIFGHNSCLDPFMWLFPSASPWACPSDTVSLEIPLCHNSMRTFFHVDTRMVATKNKRATVKDCKRFSDRFLFDLCIFQRLKMDRRL